ncbi:MAG: type II CRISPR RNA-guided endonuclease Cas9, partial [Streptococcaceae bacterium]|nr:type II CRISPR RNA-guided endonuclease Cas9 [Streptococcaceae bacterium]
ADGTVKKRKSRTNLWGARLFDAGETAADRRLKRGARRRIARRKERLNYLRGIFADEMHKIDDSFFIRLEESFYQMADKNSQKVTVRDRNGQKQEILQAKNTFKYPLFKTEAEEKAYYKDFPTIYHLRKHLMEEEEDDLRKIYLGIHHILKFRGHFIQEGIEIKVDNIDIIGNIKAFVENYNAYISEKSEIEETEFRENPEKIQISDDKLKLIEEVLKDNKISNSYKVYKIISKKNSAAILPYSVSLEAIFKAAVGNKVDISSILNRPEYTKTADEVWDKDANFKFSKETFEDELSSLPFENDDEASLILDIKAIYEAVLLSSILNGNNCLSDAMVEKYENHKKDLQVLKGFIKQYFGDSIYHDYFKAEIENNYQHYVKGFGKTKLSHATPDNFYKYLTEKLLFVKIQEFDTSYKVPTSEKVTKTLEYLKENKDNFELDFYNTIVDILQKIELETYLVKQRMFKNGAIPYQVHENELNKIIEKQSLKFPFLAKSEIPELMKFRIPYYVGTLATKNHVGWERKEDKMLQTGKASTNSWLVRKSDEKLTPWNFDEVIDKDKSAENFIVRMTSECSYLLGEKALPSNSLIYQKYKLLNELTKIKIGEDGVEKSYQFLDRETKEKALKKLFYQRRSVSKKDFNNFLHEELNYPENVQVVRGIDGRGFLNNLSTHIEFSKILGEQFVLENESFLEEIIRAKTILADKELRSKNIKEINQQYNNLLKPEQIKELARKSFTGWGNLSAKLITSFKSKVDGASSYSENKTILEFLLDDEVYNMKTQQPQLANRNFMQLINEDSLSFKKQIKEHNKAYFEENGTVDSVEDKINSLAGSPALKKGIKQTFKVVEELVTYLGRDNIKNIAMEVAKEDNAKANNHSRYKQLEEFKKNFDDDILRQYNELGKDDKEANAKLSNERLFLYFIQNGKCLYSGKPLDKYLPSLSACEIDHIIPQSYIKDDSFSNKALVIRDDNQRKLDAYPFADGIDEAVKKWWKSLYLQNKDLKMPLFTKKKYEALTRTAPFSEFEKEGFFNRQLFETRQIMKHVKNLLEEE